MILVDLCSLDCLRGQCKGKRTSLVAYRNMEFYAHAKEHVGNGSLEGMLRK